MRVSFTDDGNNAHTLESADTGVIAAATTTPPDVVAKVRVATTATGAGVMVMTLRGGSACDVL